MQELYVNDDESAKDFLAYIKEDKPKYKIQNNKVVTDEATIYLDDNYLHILDEISSSYDNALIFGKDTTEGIVALEIIDEKIHLFFNDGTVEIRPNIYWLLTPTRIRGSRKLDGNQHYKYIKTFRSYKAYMKEVNYLKNRDNYKIWNEKESAMVYNGITMFKGLKVSDVSVLSFDIEAKGLAKDDESKVFLITNTFRDTKGNITKKHFRVDHYEDDDVAMIEDWCKWVQEIDPTVITGHNIFGYDLPYIQYCYAERNGNDRMLPLGKYGYDITIGKKEVEYRVDGNTSWSYKKIQIPGRHIIDGMFMATKYYLGKAAAGSWGLKAIAEYEGFVKPDRQFYDASLIGKNWYDPIEREKIVDYGIDDSDDSLAIYDLMIPSIFYMSQSVPKPFQVMGTSASGSQLNGIMVRAYLQDNHSIPKANEQEYVAGGMSYGIPGIYTNVVKFDAASYYPSTILTFDIYDKIKDPKAYYLEMVKYFTEKRFEQKRKYKETKDTYYNDLQASSKVFINSSYGLFGTSGLNYNSFENAQLITKYCRAGLQKAVEWATNKDIDYWWEEYKESNTSSQDLTYDKIDHKTKWNYKEMPRHDWKLVNLDTDSLSFCKQDGSPFVDYEIKNIIFELNNIMYSEWEDDGYFDKVIVFKAKNYVLRDKSGKVSKKGSSITDSKKEKALTEYLNESIDDLLANGENVVDIYHKYIKEACNITDISRWSKRTSVTKAVLNPTRSNEQVVLDAISHLNPREGDKFHLYRAVDGKKPVIVNKTSNAYCPINKKTLKPKLEDNTFLKTIENYSNDHYVDHYIERVWKTLEIIENVVDKSQFLNYSLKRNKSLLEELNE